MKATLVLALLMSLSARGYGSEPTARVFPSAATIPQRLLRISIVFDAPLDESVVSDLRIRQAGADAFQPFVDFGLWSADHRLLTLLLDPSRQKTGLANHVKYGYVLRANQFAELRLRNRILKRWFVTSGPCPPLDPARWLPRAVRVGTLDTLVVRLSAPIDYLSQNDVAVSSPRRTRVAGHGTLLAGERIWSFAPAEPWQKGDRLAVHPRLEDPCGDEVHEPFEHAAGAGMYRHRSTAFYPLAVVAAGSRAQIVSRGVVYE